MLQAFQDRFVPITVDMRQCDRGRLDIPQSIGKEPFMQSHLAPIDFNAMLPERIDDLRIQVGAIAIVSGAFDPLGLSGFYFLISRMRISGGIIPKTSKP